MQTLADRVSAFLRASGLRLNTDLGQHFLVDEDVLAAIVEAGNVGPSDHVVEIGPGIGVLTAELLKRAAAVTAIELDDRLPRLLVGYLSAHVSDAEREKLRVIHGNALQVPFPQEAYSVVANIPYHITSPLLRHAYLESKTRPSSMTLLIQREVAEKICDREQAGFLTIIVALFGTARVVRRVPKDSFLPPPEVESAVLRIDSHPAPLASPQTIERILWLLKVSFAGKRKMLRNTLGKADGGADLLRKTGIDPMRRPETLSVEEWIALARADVPR